MEYAELTHYNGEAVQSLPVTAFYGSAGGLEYHCKDGYSKDGSPSGSTKITTRVTSDGISIPTYDF